MTKNTLMRSFIFGKIFNNDLQKSDEWFVKESKKFLYLKNKKSLIRLKKRNTYPQTFIIKKNNYFLFGYAEPKFLKNIFQEKFLNKILSNLQNNKLYLDKEFLIGVIDIKQKTLRLFRDSLCTLPIFYTHQNNFFAFSNSFEALVPFIFNDNKAKINFRALAEYLLCLEGDDQTIFDDIKILTERVELIKTPASLKILLPKSLVIVPKEKKYINPYKLFKKKLEKTLKKYFFKLPPNTKIGFELSGGIDSATSPVFYSFYFHKSPITFTMILPYQHGIQQKNKIKALVKKFNLINKTIAINQNKDFPFSSQIKAKSLQVFYPWREIYSDALKKLIFLMKRYKINVVFTGIGGDELFTIDSGEKEGFGGKEELEKRIKIKLPKFFTKKFKKFFCSTIFERNILPLPAVPYSVLSSNISRNNIFIENDIWPIAPLSDPFLVRFCRSLPSNLRKNKFILKIYQQSMNYPLSFYDSKENFSEFFDKSLQKPLKKFIINLYKKSVLSKHGFVNKNELIKQYQSFTKEKFKNQHQTLYFYSIAVAEIILQSILKIKNFIC